MKYSVLYPTCIKCGIAVDIWSTKLVSDAYQKDGVNYYEFTCPECKEKQSFSIPIQDYEKPKTSYFDTLKLFWSNLKAV